MLLVASSRGSVEIDQDLSLKHIGLLSLARLYGEFCMVQFRYCMSKNDEGNSLAESIFQLFQMGESIFR